MIQEDHTTAVRKGKWAGWVKKSGIVVFSLFLLKGLVWLALGAAVWMGLMAKN
ncbi:MAG: alanyl-tRNA synthetase [Bacteroidetes bacterium]|nr:alanyl-tRNA synthetase [Bacteroidota bacterium]MBS1684622.1 alanyl-tRNA synthetase [Bacteroidota bacterium]